MATLQNNTVSRFHNLSNEALADAIGRADAIVKAAEAELSALKDEIKGRGLAEVAGDEFAVTATEQIAGRLDTKAVKAFLGDSYVKFEKAIVSTVIRVKAANRLALAA
jgi:microcompartment protein CcmL/EutN